MSLTSASRPQWNDPSASAIAPRSAVSSRERIAASSASVAAARRLVAAAAAASSS